MKSKKQVTKIIHNQLEKAIQQYVDVFCAKHELDFEYWVGNMSGGVGVFNDYFFNFDDIRVDLDTDQPEDEIFKWYDVAVELRMDNKPAMNYHSWTTGLRKEMIIKNKDKEIEIGDGC